jgi:hypothetical protein
MNLGLTISLFCNMLVRDGIRRGTQIQVAGATKFSNICCSSVWNLLHVTLLASGILMWPLDICVCVCVYIYIYIYIFIYLFMGLFKDQDI